MSYTALWEIDKNWSGKELAAYHNSWLFPPTVWDVLMCKYITYAERDFCVSSFMAWMSTFDDKERNRRFKMLNERINNSEAQHDRVLWELTNLSVFNAKDKEFVAGCIETFAQEYIEPNPKYEGHIKDRFFEVAKDIRELPKRCRYFVIQPNTVSDAVEWWFDGKQLSSWDKFICEFTLINEGKVVGFSTNLEMCKKES